MHPLWDSDPDNTRSSLLRHIRDLDNDEAWRRFWRTYRGFVRRIARSRGLNEHDAEDIAQEVLVQVARTIHEFKRQPRIGSFRAWLRTLVRSHTRIYRREHRNPRIISLEDAQEEDARSWGMVERIHDPTVGLELACRIKLLRMALRRLKMVDPLKIQIYELYVVDRWEPATIAKFLGISRATVYTVKCRLGPRVSRALAGLQRELLEAQDPSPRHGGHKQQGSRRPGWPWMADPQAGEASSL